jgi:hypothetical protein
MGGLVKGIVDWAHAHPPTGDLSAWLKAFAVFVGAAWTLVTFARNNRIKAAELLLNLEQQCRDHLGTLLRVEYLSDYRRHCADALKKSVPRGEEYTDPESAAVNELDMLLRHLHACYHVRRLHVDVHALDRAYTYYLRLCISDDRPELRNYVLYYWPNVFLWAQRVGEPWPKRTYIWWRQIPFRYSRWWYGHDWKAALSQKAVSRV